MKRMLILPAVAFAVALVPAQAASAQSGGSEVLQADLTPQNGSTANATATVTMRAAR